MAAETPCGATTINPMTSPEFQALTMGPREGETAEQIMERLTRAREIATAATKARQMKPWRDLWDTLR